MVQASTLGSSFAVAGVLLFGGVALSGCGSGLQDYHTPDVDAVEVDRHTVALYPACDVDGVTDDTCWTKIPWRMRVDRICGNQALNDNCGTHDFLWQAKQACTQKNGQGDTAKCLGVERTKRPGLLNDNQSPLANPWGDGKWRCIMYNDYLRPCGYTPRWEAHFKKSLGWIRILDYTCLETGEDEDEDAGYPNCGSEDTVWNTLEAAQHGCSDNPNCVGIEQSDTMDGEEVLSTTFQCLRMVEKEPICVSTSDHIPLITGYVTVDTKKTIWVDAADGF